MSNDTGKTQVMTHGLGVQDAEQILRDIGRSMRRVEVSRAKDPPGLRCVWHQGKMRSELLSWEKLDDKKIDRQELSFFGKMVEYTPGQGIRTGVIAESSMAEGGPRVAKSELFMPTREPDLMLLDAASRILRECPKRDYFTQHLLKLINDALTKLEKKAARTQVNGLDFFRTIEQAAAQERAREAATKKMSMTVAYAIVGVAVLIAGGLFWFLWRS